jgi:hypothetical protein
VGIIKDPSVAGLPDGLAWNIFQGGSGFAPPYALPNQNATLQPSPEADRVAVPVTGSGRQFEFETESATANKYIQSLAQGRLPPPGKVFCSRELEKGLVEHVTEQTAPFGLGEFPSDNDLRAKAREILGLPNTSADDPVLLEKFKDMVREKLSLGLGAPTTVASGSTSTPASQNRSQSQSQQLSAASPTDAFGDIPLDLDLNLTDSQMTDILQDMDFQFGDVTGLNDSVLGSGFGL